MPYVLDTSILVRLANRRDPKRPEAEAAVQRLRRRGEFLHVAPQNLIEFWNVTTRPLESNGLGQAPAHARALVDRLCRLFALLPETERLFEQWLFLATAAAVSGRQVHDTRIAAAMLVHGIPNVLTFNVADFVRFQPFGVTAMHPADVRD